MAVVKTNGVEIDYAVHGDGGDPLLLIMGLGGQRIDWPDEFIGELVGQGFRVITPDNRDSGLSTEIDVDPPTEWQLAKSVLFNRSLPHAYVIDDFADDHLGVLDDLGIESAHIAGVSMGGMISQSMVTRYPNRARSLTSIMSTTGNPRVGGAKLSTLIKMSRHRGKPRSEAVEAAVATFRLIGGPGFNEARTRAMALAAVERSYRPEGTARQLAAIISSADRTEALGTVTAPTLVVHGLLDPLVKPSGGIATAKAVPKSRLVMYPDMAHDLPESRWSDLAAEIRQTADAAG